MTVEYDIAQVVFVVSNKKQQVFPVQIAEKIQKSTIDGDETLYKVKVPIADYADQLFELDRIDGEIYTSIDKVRILLKQKINQQIDDLVDNAQKTANEVFGMEEEEELELDLPILKSVPKKSKSQKKKDQRAAQKEQIVEAQQQRQERQRELEPSPVLPMQMDDSIITDADGNPIGKIRNIEGLSAIEERGR